MLLNLCPRSIFKHPFLLLFYPWKVLYFTRYVMRRKRTRIVPKTNIFSESKCGTEWVIIEEEAFIMLCAYLCVCVCTLCHSGALVDCVSSGVHSHSSLHCIWLFWASATSSIWLKTCNKSTRLSWKSPSRVMAKWSPATVFVGCVFLYVYMCVWVCTPAHLLEHHGQREPCWEIDDWLGSFMMELSALLWHILLAVALLTVRTTSECIFSHILSEFWMEWSTDCLVAFIFTTVRAKKWWFTCRN